MSVNSEKSSSSERYSCISCMNDSWCSIAKQRRRVFFLFLVKFAGIVYVLHAGYCTVSIEPLFLVKLCAFLQRLIFFFFLMKPTELQHANHTTAGCWFVCAGVADLAAFHCHANSISISKFVFKDLAFLLCCRKQFHGCKGFLSI